MNQENDGILVGIKKIFFPTTISFHLIEIKFNENRKELKEKGRESDQMESKWVKMKVKNERSGKWI